ncbi:hypothetical protein SUGI_0128380 [Cryptomeria japonica]|nr:hypothetical protein SUGI_0128380 [Cryptomeria japonica]
MEKGNLGLIQAKALVDSPTRISNSSDTLYDSHNLSSENLSSTNSIDSELVNENSSSTLDWLESSCINSFDDPFIIEKQDYATERRTYEVVWEDSSNGEAHFITPDYLEDDFMSCMDGTDTDPHLLKNTDGANIDSHLLKDLELQSNTDDSDCFGYWLHASRQARASPTLL